MGMLSMNPDNPGLEGGPKLAARVAEEEEYLGPDPGIEFDLPVEEEKPEKDPVKKMKIAGFELDTTYPRTLLGFLRICQILILLVAFICLVITSSWPDSGIYTFFCIILVFGAIVSGYLFFTIIAGTRGETFCGISWILLELIYFAGFGSLIFLGSCLAANKSEGNAALQASAVFGFGAVITFGYYFWVTWKLRKSKKEIDEKPNLPPGSEVGDDIEKRTMTPGFDQDGDFKIDMEDAISEQHSRHPSVDFSKKNRSLPLELNDQIYENHTIINDEKLNPHRRRHSASEKDSAYGEGEETPTRKKRIPLKMRRTASAYDIKMNDDMHNVLQRQPLAHLTHRPYGGRPEDGFRRSSSMHRHARIGYGYPRELATNSFTNMGFNNDGSRVEEDDLHKLMGRQKSMPDWLQSALEVEVAPNDMMDDESEVAMPPVKRVSTLPAFNPKQFPLLNTSDEESIAYPSISHHGHSRTVQTMMHQQQRRSHGYGAEMHRHHHHHRGGHHSSGRRRGHHRHHHGRRHRHQSNHHHRHHGHPRPQNGANGNHFRLPVDGTHETYLREMMENDELVAKESLQRDMRGFQRHEGKPIESGQRRVIPEKRLSIHFPEKSRWDDEGAQFDNQVMEKYLADTQAHYMRR